MRPQKAPPWPEPRRLMYNMWGSSARGRLWAYPTSHRETKLRGPYISPIWGAATPQVIIMNFDLLVDLADVINFSNFGIDRMGGSLFCEVLKMAISYT